MSFCPACGRQRVGSTRYCGGCGRDFGVAATSGSTVLAEKPAILEPPSTATVRSAGPAGMLPPKPPEPGRLVDRPPEGRRKQTLWIAVAVIVLLLAAGGGAFALVKTTGKPKAAQPGNTPPSLAAGTTTPPTRAATTQPAPSPVPTLPSPSPSPSVVAIAPSLLSVDPQVEVVLRHYFQGINNRNYAEYASSQNAAGKKDQPESSFDRGYKTTTDSDMLLTTLTPTGNGDLTATVTFTSRQSPSDSVDGSACNDWTLNLYLVPGGSGYLIAPAPPDYEPAHSDC